MRVFTVKLCTEFKVATHDKYAEIPSGILIREAGIKHLNEMEIDALEKEVFVIDSFDEHHGLTKVEIREVVDDQNESWSLVAFKSRPYSGTFAIYQYMDDGTQQWLYDLADDLPVCSKIRLLSAQARRAVMSNGVPGLSIRQDLSRLSFAYVDNNHQLLAYQ